jgi:hypothetical protein
LTILNEGVPVYIEWHLLTPGSTFFIPAFKTSELARAVRKAASAKGIRLVHKVCVDNGMYGIRFWRKDEAVIE